MRKGSNLDPKIRFESVHLEPNFDDLRHDPEFIDSQTNRNIQLFP